MRYLKIIFFVLLILNFYNLSFAEETYFVDMNKLLNQSKAGKEAQDFLKEKIITRDKKFREEGELLKKEEIDLIAKKKTLPKDEYKKALNQLREKNIKFQRKRANFTTAITTQRAEARSRLLKALDPILMKYMSENNVQIIVYNRSMATLHTGFPIQ